MSILQDKDSDRLYQETPSDIAQVKIQTIESDDPNPNPYWNLGFASINQEIHFTFQTHRDIGKGQPGWEPVHAAGIFENQRKRQSKWNLD